MSKPLSQKLIAQNRQARFNYQIEDKMEAGIVLAGSEVKSLRKGGASITESYASAENGEVFLINANILPYGNANIFNHEPKRLRKLLLKRKEIRRVTGALTRKGMTLVPLSMYFNEKGRVKVELGLASGKNKADKRATIKEREWKRDQSRMLSGQHSK